MFFKVKKPHSNLLLWGFSLFNFYNPKIIKSTKKAGGGW